MNLDPVLNNVMPISKETPVKILPNMAFVNMATDAISNMMKEQ